MEKLQNREELKSPEKSQILNKLNKEQKEAVLYNKSPLLIQAGVGTGKTETLMRKYAYLISKGVKPSSILCVTFTNKAAKEMVDRAGSLVGDQVRDDIWINTFHAISARILIQNKHYEVIGLKPDYHIIDKNNQKKVITTLLKEDESTKNQFKRLLKEEQSQKGGGANGLQTDWNKVNVPYSRIAKTIDSFKNQCILPDSDMPKSLNKFDQSVFRLVYTEYQEHLLKENLIDYGDMILYTIQLFEKSNEILDQYHNLFKHILVDEVQDLNPNQEKWLKLIVGKNQQLTCVGDEDQLIYGFRGAVGNLILNFEKIFTNAKVIMLEQNYRSTKRILEAANNLIKRNHDGKDTKQLRTENKDGDHVSIQSYQDQEVESMVVCQSIKDCQKSNQDLSQIAVLTRTNRDAKNIEKHLILENIPYELGPNIKRFLEKKEVKLALQFLIILNRSNDNFALKYVLQESPGFGDKAIENIEKYKTGLNVSLWQALKSLVQDDKSQINGKLTQKRKNTSSASQLQMSIFQQSQFRNQNAKEEEKKEPPIQKIKLNKPQKEFIVKLLKLKETYKGTNEKEKLERYLKEAGFYDQMNKKEKNPSSKYVENVDVLFEIASKFQDMEEFYTHVSLFTGEIQTQANQKGIKLLTMHSSKGLEFNKVFLPFWTERNIPNMKDCKNDIERIQEERRLAFVGITRARQHVHISYYQQCKYSGFQQQKSRFINDILQHRQQNKNFYF